MYKSLINEIEQISSKEYNNIAKLHLLYNNNDIFFILSEVEISLTEIKTLNNDL